MAPKAKSILDWKIPILNRLRPISRDQGLTLIEVMVSMVVMVAGMLTIFPLFAAPKVQAVDNQLRKAEVAIAQNILDEIRQTDWDILGPLEGDQTSLPPTTTGGNDGDSLTNISYGERNFDAVISYCPGDPNPIIDEEGDAVCVSGVDNGVKAVRVEVRRRDWGYELDENNEVEDGQYYTIEAIFTDLRDE